MVEKDKTTRIYSFVRPIHHDEKEFYSNNSAQEVYPVQSESAKIVGEALIGLVDITDYMTSFESQPDREFYKSLGVRGYFLPGPGWWITPSSTSASEIFLFIKREAILAMKIAATW